MEQLISFIMDHFVIAVIVIGLIYFMFFRRSPLEKRPPNRMPEFGGAPIFPQRPRRPVVRQGPPPVERTEPLPEYRELPTELPMRPSPQETARPIWASVEPNVVPAEKQAVRLDSPTAAKSDVPSAAAAMHQPPTDSPLTREDLTRAIVWAEILGPPRSRRPFRRT